MHSNVKRIFWTFVHLTAKPLLIWDRRPLYTAPPNSIALSIDTPYTKILKS